MAVVEERDQLCDRISGYESENKQLQDSVLTLNEEIASLSSHNSVLKNTILDLEETNQQLTEENQTLTKEQIQLQKEYSNLFTDSYTQAHLYNERLKVKEQELSKKEQLLLEREAAIRELQQELARQDSIAKRMNDILRNALLGFNSDELTVEIKNGKVYISMSDKLLFKSGSASVENKGQEALGIVARVLEKNQDFDILIEGHTDNVPIKTAQYADNWDLSVARATSIVRILAGKYNLDPKRLTASGKGEFSPRASNETTQGRAQNRRTEIILSPRLNELMELLNE
ncbi:OmpA family protein [Wandonia haliotis]|uniref:OmpA family protein n=2 Tax=Wandonia haliotis TaxID=574963 RepID=A0ABN1MUA0_9FLAO